MSETISLDFVLRRIDAANNNVNDVRRSMIALATRFDAIEARFGAMETRFAMIEARMDAMVERFSGVETRLDQMMAVLLEIKEK